MCGDFFDDFDGDFDGEPGDHDGGGIGDDDFEGTEPEFDAEAEMEEPSCMDGISWCEMGLFLAMAEQIEKERRERDRIRRENDEDEDDYWDIINRRW